jgi:hypothetical protein
VQPATIAATAQASIIGKGVLTTASFAIKDAPAG